MMNHFEKKYQVLLYIKHWYSFMPLPAHTRYYFLEYSIVSWSMQSKLVTADILSCSGKISSHKYIYIHTHLYAISFITLQWSDFKSCMHIIVSFRILWYLVNDTRERVNNNGLVATDAEVKQKHAYK